MTPPRIETGRLVLRAHVAADFDDLHALWSDPRVTAHISAAPSSPAESWARLLRYRGLWAVLDFGYWAVEERATGRFVGDTGFGDFHRPLEPPLGKLPEAGWVFTSSAQGSGYATEAAGAALCWLDAGPHRSSVCLIRPDNTASLRVAAKLGYGAVQPGRLGDVATLVLRRDVP